MNQFINEWVSDLLFIETWSHNIFDVPITGQKWINKASYSVYSCCPSPTWPCHPHNRHNFQYLTLPVLRIFFGKKVELELILIRIRQNDAEPYPTPDPDPQHCWAQCHFIPLHLHILSIPPVPSSPWSRHPIIVIISIFWTLLKKFSGKK